VRLCRLQVDLRDLMPADRIRVLLVADVWRRVREDLQGGQVLVAVVTDACSDCDAAALAIREPVGRARTPDEVADLLAGPPDVAVTAAGADHRAAGTVVGVGPATPPPPVDEPLVLRLALLRVPVAEPAELSAARVYRAAETLRRWRIKVAGWADMPSAAPPRAEYDAMRAALVERLGTPGVLATLHRLETDPRLSSGAKFEAFVGVDRVLALDLGRLIGKLPR
jgi:hypothetical protein